MVHSWQPDERDALEIMFKEYGLDNARVADAHRIFNNIFIISRPSASPWTAPPGTGRLRDEWRGRFLTERSRKWRNIHSKTVQAYTQPEQARRARVRVEVLQAARNLHIQLTPTPQTTALHAIALITMAGRSAFTGIATLAPPMALAVQPTSTLQPTIIQAATSVTLPTVTNTAPFFVTHAQVPTIQSLIPLGQQQAVPVIEVPAQPKMATAPSLLLDPATQVSIARLSQMPAPLTTGAPVPVGSLYHRSRRLINKAKRTSSRPAPDTGASMRKRSGDVVAGPDSEPQAIQRSKSPTEKDDNMSTRSKQSKSSSSCKQIDRVDRVKGFVAGGGNEIPLFNYPAGQQALFSFGDPPLYPSTFHQTSSLAEAASNKTLMDHGDKYNIGFTQEALGYAGSGKKAIGAEEVDEAGADRNVTIPNSLPSVPRGSVSNGLPTSTSSDIALISLFAEKSMRQADSTATAPGDEVSSHAMYNTVSEVDKDTIVVAQKKFKRNATVPLEDPSSMHDNSPRKLKRPRKDNLFRQREDQRHRQHTSDHIEQDGARLGQNLDDANKEQLHTAGQPGDQVANQWLRFSQSRTQSNREKLGTLIVEGNINYGHAQHLGTEQLQKELGSESVSVPASGSVVPAPAGAKKKGHQVLIVGGDAERGNQAVPSADVDGNDVEDEDVKGGDDEEGDQAVDDNEGGDAEVINFGDGNEKANATEQPFGLRADDAEAWVIEDNIFHDFFEEVGANGLNSLFPDLFR